MEILNEWLSKEKNVLVPNKHILEKNLYYRTGKGMIKETGRKIKKNIKLAKHAWERWNERVGSIESEEMLENKINQLKRLGRISLNEHYGIIDNDLLFIFKRIKNYIYIITFLGSINKYPSLQHTYYTIKEKNEIFKIDLKRNEKELDEMVPMPFYSVKCKGKKGTEKTFEVYKVEEEGYIYVLFEKERKRTTKTLTILEKEDFKRKDYQLFFKYYRDSMKQEA